MSQALREPSSSVSSKARTEPPSAPVFPEAGELFGDFQLIAELGRGGQGCVFLATQRFLGDRPVVLKLSARDGGEHLSLARLQHTYIVPLYFAEDDHDRNVRLLCMPYFGSATLKHLLDLLKPVPSAQRTGKHIVDALDTHQESVPIVLPARGPARQMLARASYVQAIGWMGACLAEALHYAHERGLVHLDIKPSNVLLAVDGQPMLLDFHLAQSPIQPNTSVPDWLGGSPMYMSPEHKATLNAVRKDQPVPATVDGRSDIFSLGALLYEALGGGLPFRSDSSPALHRINPQVSLGLSDIIHKCLSAEPTARYQTAGALAADLQRHLNNQALRGVKNRSVGERWRKWRRRSPTALAVIGLGIAVVIASVGLLVFRQSNIAEARHQMHALRATGEEQLAQGRYDEAITTARHGLVLADGLSTDHETTRDLTELLRRAERAQTSRELTRLADRLRYMYGVETLAPAELQSLENRCKLFWENRDDIVKRLGTDASSSAGLSQIQTDLLDLALLWTDLRLRLAAADAKASTRKDAISVLRQAEATFGHSPVLSAQLATHRRALGEFEPDSGTTPTPRTPWEHYALGRVFFQSGELDQAASEFQQACRLQAQGFWPNFYAGLCAYRQKKYIEAIAAFSVCIGADPKNAACYINRALAYAGMERDDRALRDLDQAHELDPKLASALLNRGLLHYREQRYAEAVADLQRALELAAPAATVHYNLALVRIAQRDQAAAFEHLRQALQSDPNHAPSRQLVDRLRK